MNSTKYMQTDSRWGGLGYPKSPYFIRNCGCGECAIANIIIEIDKYKNYTPATIQPYCKQYADPKGNGTYWAGIPKMLAHYGLTEVKDHATMTPLWTELAKGNRVAVYLMGSRKGGNKGVKWTSSGHFVCSVGYKYENGKEIIRNSSHVLEIILKLYNLHFKLLKRVNSKFFSELNKYPEICKEKQAKEKRNTKKFCAWMEMGRQQGLFREDADFNILTFILKRDLTTIIEVKMQKGHTELSDYTPDELGRKLILFYLRGISTPKGQEIIEEYLKRNETIIE